MRYKHRKNRAHNHRGHLHTNGSLERFFKIICASEQQRGTEQDILNMERASADRELEAFGAASASLLEILHDAQERVSGLEKEKAALNSDGPHLGDLVAVLELLEQLRALSKETTILWRTTQLEGETQDNTPRQVPELSLAKATSPLRRYVQGLASVQAKFLVLAGSFETLMTDKERKRLAQLFTVEVSGSKGEDTSCLAAFFGCQRTLIALHRQISQERERNAQRLGLGTGGHGADDIVRRHTFALASRFLAPAILEHRNLKSLASVAEAIGLPEELVKTLASLPDYLCGPLANKAFAFDRLKYFEFVIDSLFSQDISNITNVQNQLIAKWVAIGQSDVVARVLVRESTLLGHATILESLPLNSRETLWKAILRISGAACKTPGDAKDLVSKIFPFESIRKPGHMQDFAFRKLFLRPRTIPRAALWGLTHYLREVSIKEQIDSKGQSKANIFLDQTRHIASIWSDRSFVSNSDLETLSFVSGALYNLLLLMNAKEIHQSGVLLRVVTGVQHYLEAANPDIRILGMLMAVQISKISSPEHPLVFQEIESMPGFLFAPPGSKLFWDIDTDLEEGSETNGDEVEGDNFAFASQQTESSAAEKSVEEMSGTVAKPTKSYNIWDDSSDDDDDDSEHDSDDEDAPSRHVGVPEAGSRDQEQSGIDEGNEIDESLLPFYLHDAIKVFQEGKEFAAFQASLQGLANLIYRRPADLNRSAGELTHLLLHLENKFSQHGFADSRMQALVALIETAPPAAASVLIAEATQERATFISVRTCALEALVLGAQGLQKGTSRAFQEQDVLPETGEIPAGSNMVKPPIKQVGRVIRRWGQRKTPAPIERKSRFSGLAGPVFFYPLLNSGLATLKTPGMQEPIVLAKFLFALASILAAAQHAPDTSRMGRALYKILWSLRRHDDAQIRRAALFSLAQILLVVPVAVLSEDDDWLASIGDSKEWVQLVMQRDPDTSCREQASLLNRMLSPAQRASSSASSST